MAHHDGASSIRVRKDRFLSLSGASSSKAVAWWLHALGGHAFCPPVQKKIIVAFLCLWFCSENSRNGVFVTGELCFLKRKGVRGRGPRSSPGVCSGLG